MSDQPKFLSIESIKYQPLPAEEMTPGEPDGFPEFLITGTFLPTGEKFARKVALEFDGRDAEDEHVSGLDISQTEHDYYDLQQELIDAIGDDAEYKRLSVAYYGE